MAVVDADPPSRWNTGPAIVNFTFGIPYNIVLAVDYLQSLRNGAGIFKMGMIKEQYLINEVIAIVSIN